MISKAPAQTGFTAVELLITLFVAALFLFAGYQLYNVILSSGTTARNQTLAGSVANNYIQQYADSIEAPCNAYSPILDEPITVEGLSETTASVTFSCPVSDANNLSQISVTITYGVGAETTSLTRVAFFGASS